MKKIFLLFCICPVFLACTSKHEKAVELNKKGIRNIYERHTEEALADFNNAIKLDPLYDQPYYYRGNLKFGAADYQGALADYSKAIELNAGFAEAYANRGNLYEAINRRDKACEDWVKADELGKPNLEDKLEHCR